jgi:hypothetical protein
MCERGERLMGLGTRLLRMSSQCIDTYRQCGEFYASAIMECIIETEGLSLKQRVGVQKLLSNQLEKTIIIHACGLYTWAVIQRYKSWILCF